MIDKLEVKNLLEEMDLVRRLHGKIDKRHLQTTAVFLVYTCSNEGNADYVVLNKLYNFFLPDRICEVKTMAEERHLTMIRWSGEIKIILCSS